jgi:nucleoside-triphosphatase
MEVDVPTREIFVITGKFGSGKTVFCTELADIWMKAGRQVGGMISPARFQQGRKTGIYARELPSGESRLLASAIPEEMEGIILGMWTFNPGSVVWGNHCFASIDQTDLLLIDELGPFEFNQNMGWMKAFDALNQARYRVAAVVIRPTCIERFRERGFDFQVIDLDTVQDPKELLQQLAPEKFPGM